MQTVAWHCWKATSVSPLQAPTLPVAPSILLRLVLLPAPHVTLQWPQLPQADQLQASPGKGEQKSQSPRAVVWVWHQ